MKNKSATTLYFGFKIVLALTCLTILGTVTVAVAADQCRAVFSKDTKTYLDFTYYYPVRLNVQNQVHNFYAKNRFSHDGKVTPVHDPLTNESSLVKETEKPLEFVYSIYSERGTLPPDFIDHLRKRDRELEPQHSVFVTWTEPKTDQLKAVIRIYDASPETRLNEDLGATRLPLERDFPNLVIPERKNGNPYLIEFGRLGKTSDVEGDGRAILKAISDYVLGSHYSSESAQNLTLASKKEPVIYVGCSPIAARLYKKAGFDVAFTPDQVGKEDMFILRMKASDLIKKFHGSTESYRIETQD